MSTINVNELAKVRSLLAEALAEKGLGYVYEMPLEWDVDRNMGEGAWVAATECRYVAPVVKDRDGADDAPMAPSCLWGHVLVGWGCPVDALVPVNGMAISDIEVPWTDPLITRAARFSQMAQDRDESWGEAVQVFEDEIKEGLL